MTDSVLYEQEGAVVTITLNRPEKMNAYNMAVHHGLYDAIDRAEADKSVRAIVVTGAGKAYCAGADISEGFAALSEGTPEIDGIPRDYGGMLNLRIFECDTPIVAAVNGAAVGVGATMLLPMDIKIVSENAKFAFPFGRRGIVFDGAASFFLPRIVGMTKASEWILRGDIIRPDEALSAGMVNEVVAPEEVLPRALEIARDIAENVAPQSSALNKQLLRASLLNDTTYGDPAMSAHMAESRILMERFKSSDCMEGVMSFLQKRPPKFADRG